MTPAERLDAIIEDVRRALPRWVPRRVLNAYLEENREQLLARIEARIAAKPAGMPPQETIELGNNETAARGVFLQPNGRYLALTLSASKWFDDPDAAARWYARQTGSDERQTGDDELASDAPPGVSVDDIPRDLAERAHAGTSWVPDERAAGERRNYVAHMRSVWLALHRRSRAPEDLRHAASLFADYRTAWLARYRALLGRRASLVSPFIAGRSNFPVRRQRKRGDAFDRALQEFISWDQREQGRMLQALRPDEPRTISADRTDAVELLRKKLSDLQVLQETMVAANKIIRKKGLTDDERIEQLRALMPRTSDDRLRSLLRRDDFGNLGFAAFQLSNNNAEIRRIETRIEQISRERARPAASFSFAGRDGDPGGHIEEDLVINRVQIHFDAPRVSRLLYDKLKSAGFHRTREGVWQRQRNDAARFAVERVLGVTWPSAAELQPANDPPAVTFVLPEDPAEVAPEGAEPADIPNRPF